MVTRGPDGHESEVHSNVKLHRSLWWLHPNTFQADNESSVHWIDRFRLQYREGDRSTLIEHDLQAPPRLMAIWRESMKSWQPPRDQDPLDEADKDRIIANMRRAFTARNYTLDLLDE